MPKYCSVDSCYIKDQSGQGPFFRYPKDPIRCQQWKKAVGFIGNHRYANLTPEQCYNRIVICSRHFTKDSFTCKFGNRLSINAVPSIDLPSESERHESSEAVKKTFSHAGVQTDKVDHTHATAQTLEGRSWKSKILNTEDVVNFLELNYPQNPTWKIQLNLLQPNTDYQKILAFGLYILGPKIYRQMSNNHTPLPKPPLHKVTIHEGFNEFIFKLTEFRAKTMTDKDKDCIVCLDEIPLKPHLYYDISKDTIIGLQQGSTEVATTALVVMIRSIKCDWKQPIAYFYTSDVKKIVSETVSRLSSAGLNVLAVVSKGQMDLDLVCLQDVPHLLTTTRNNLWEKDGEYIEAMYQYDKAKEWRLCPKLTDEHMIRDNVKYASEVFSRSTAAALSCFADYNILPPQAKATAQFVDKLSRLFDILNNKLHTYEQVKFLESMRELEGWHTTINGVLKLWQIVKSKGHKVLLTKNLNLCSEDFFPLQNCTPIQFSRAFKNMLFLHQDYLQDYTDALQFLSLNSLDFLPANVPKNSLKVFTTGYQNLKTSLTGYLLYETAQRHTCDVCDKFKMSCDCCMVKVVPSSMREYVTMLETMFVEHFTEFAYEDGVSVKVKSTLQHVELPRICRHFPKDYFLSLYARARIYFALKFANKDIEMKKSLDVTILKNL